MKYDKNYTAEVAKKYKNIKQDEFKKIIPGTDRGTYCLLIDGVWVEGFLLDANADQFKDVCTLDNNRFVAIDDYDSEMEWDIRQASDDAYSGIFHAAGECVPIIFAEHINPENEERMLCDYCSMDYYRWSEIASNFGVEARAFEHSELREMEKTFDSLFDQYEYNREEDNGWLFSWLTEGCKQYIARYRQHEQPSPMYFDGFAEGTGNPLTVLEDVCSNRFSKEDTDIIIDAVKENLD